MTGGILVFRAGWRQMAKNALLGGILLGGMEAISYALEGFGHEEEPEPVAGAPAPMQLPPKHLPEKYTPSIFSRKAVVPVIKPPQPGSTAQYVDPNSAAVEPQVDMVPVRFMPVGSDSPSANSF
jgi:hypothetical protein